MRFTNNGLKALKPKLQRYERWEDGRTGLGLRVSPNGHKTFVYMYRFNGKARRMTLGRFPALSLSQAGVLLAHAKARKDDGHDPGAEQVEKRRANRDADTVGMLIEEYMKRHARPNRRSAEADERMLSKEVEPLWG